MAASDPTPPHSLHALYQDHQGWLQGWLRKKLGNALDAADLVHDTYLRVLSRRELAISASLVRTSRPSRTA